MKPKISGEIQKCKTVHTVSFHFSCGLRFSSFEAGISRHHNLEKTRLFKENEFWLTLLIMALEGL